jgi:hypothetical protein
MSYRISTELTRREGLAILAMSNDELKEFAHYWLVRDAFAPWEPSCETRLPIPCRDARRMPDGNIEWDVDELEGCDPPIIVAGTELRSPDGRLAWRVDWPRHRRVGVGDRLAISPKWGVADHASPFFSELFANVPWVPEPKGSNARPVTEDEIEMHLAFSRSKFGGDE